MGRKVWAKVVKTPKSFKLKSPYMTEIRDGTGWRTNKYHSTKKAANDEVKRITRLNKGR
jgi:hypothetical protein